MYAATHLADYLVADAQTKAGATAATRRKAVEDMLLQLGRNATAAVVEGHYQRVDDIVVSGTHLTVLSILGGVGSYPVDDHAEVVHVNVDHQLLVRVVHDVRDAGLAQIEPCRLAAGVKERSEVERRALEFNHLGIQTGKEQDVVDEFQQAL